MNTAASADIFLCLIITNLDRISSSPSVGECSIQIHDKIRDSDVFIIQPTCMPVSLKPHCNFPLLAETAWD